MVMYRVIPWQNVKNTMSVSTWWGLDYRKNVKIHVNMDDFTRCLIGWPLIGFQVQVNIRYKWESRVKTKLFLIYFMKS